MATPDSATAPSLQRQRCCILLVDLVESVRLMRDREAEVVGRWHAFVELVRRQLLPAHGGRMINSRADGILMAFDAVPGAVSAAFSLHSSMERDNVGLPFDGRMVLRAGMHVGAVYITSDDLIGAEVNLTARLCAFAQPGQTLLSAEAHKCLVDGLHADLEDIGERYLKHIERPVRIFRAAPPTYGRGVAAPTRHAPPATDLRPTLAVVPFRCLPALQSHDALGHAMADDIIAALSRHPGLRVLSRLSTEALRDTPLDLASTRDLLGATYLLRGDNHVRGHRVHLRAELCDLGSGEVLWAGSAYADIDALFAGQDDLVPSVVAQVSQQVHAHELGRARRLPMSTLASYTLYLGASGLMNSLLSSDFELARQAIEQLIERHPRQAAPHAMLAHWHLFRVVQGWAERRDDEALRAWDQVHRALDIDADLPAAHVAAAMASDTLDRDAEGTRAHAEQALAIDPAHPHAWVLMSGAQLTAGEHERGLQSARRAIELSPLDPRRFLFESYASRAAFTCRLHDEAAVHARASLRRNLHHAPAHRMLVGSLWEAGDHDGARAAARQYLMVFPGASAAGPIDPKSQPQQLSRFVAALLEAGVPG